MIQRYHNNFLAEREMKTIFTPIDFSERADSALKQIVTLAKRFKSKVIVYHVYHHPFIKTDSSIHLDGLLENLERGIDKQFKEFLEANSDFQALDHEFRKERGLSSEKIIETIKNENIDLVCMATKGAQGMGELWGTKTAKIVKSIDVPVLVIPDNTHLANIKKVGLVADYSQEANYHSLDFLSNIMEALNLEVDVITFNKDEKHLSSSEKAYRQLVKKKLENVPTSFHFTSGNDLEHGLMDYCLENDIGLIAILHKKYNFLVQLFHESLTEKMTFRSHIPILVLK